jgi:formylglycine-generating enzyme required for sulfatase activity
MQTTAARAATPARRASSAQRAFCLTVCGAGQTNCSGVCRNLASDPEACGACGRACTAGDSCVSSACIAAPCPLGMVLIAAGAFVMGDASPLMGDAGTVSGDAGTVSNLSRSLHMVTLTRPFCLDSTEVTVSAYRSCPTSACTLPPISGTYFNWNVTGRDNHPINGVTWHQARAFCQWRGGDLPTEAQWEYAARGTDGRIYPWGNTAPGSQLCWSRFPSPGSTCAVRSYPATLNGLFDMAGNVWEWTLDAYMAHSSAAVVDPIGVGGGSAVFRGGSWSGTTETFMRAAFRGVSGQTARNNDIGFRCMRAPR